jgi:hypothetical protein
MSMRILIFSLPLFIAACGGNPVSETNTEAQKPAKEEAVKVKGLNGKKSYTAEELNEPYSRVSPWRYIVTSPETQYFERMVGQSTLARTVHSSGNLILIPEDPTFTENRDWKGILDEGQEEALDRFVKAHILQGGKGIKMLEGTYENLNGETVAIERDEQGQLICGNARLLGRELETDKGIVVPVAGLVEDIQWN